jgi:subtilisin family serine protease
VTVARGHETASLARYRNNPNVLYAEPNYVRSIPKPAAQGQAAPVMPGDYYFREQWALHNTGQQFVCFPWIDGELLCLYVGTPDADIDAPEAWAVSQGTNIPVAIVDSGIDYTHPDLASKFIGGWDFVNNDGDPMDDHGHGTHVAGIIAAEMNNPTGDPAADEGVVGVAPNAVILSYKVCTPDGSCDDFAISQGIDRAVTDGARVINLSLGGTEYSQAMFDSVQAAWSAGLVIVAAAGNNGVTTPFYPAAFPHVLSVGAFDEDDLRASFSNYSTDADDWVELAAPGNVIMSSYPIWQCGATGTTPGDIGCYNWLSGTSMAAPHVSGAAALVWSRSDVVSNQQVVDILENSADPVGVSPVRLDSWTRHGGLNIHNAMTYTLNSNVMPIANAGPDQTLVDTNNDGSEQVTLNGSASSDPDGSIVSYEWRDNTTVIASGVSPSVWLNVGTHTLTLQVTDNSGDSNTDTVLIIVNAPPNVPPVANAGPDQIVTDNDGNGTEVVTLNGTASSDSDGTIVTYAWKEGPNVVATGANPNVSLSVGTHTLTLQVTDDDGASSTDSVLIAVNPKPNAPPSANAGADQTVTDSDGNGTQAVTLNGAASSDSDGTIVSYVWREGASTVATGVSPTVSLSVGTHTLTLQVTDDDGATATDSVTVTVNPFVPPPPSPTVHIGDLDGSTAANKSSWSATVTVAVHNNSNHGAVSGVLVTGT